ncbi:hypothetical protein X729_31920 [Mesorhizobium sp. L103C131B0]|nr:hypothetical protein X729_31920 [Mesorhizobium sp. L103C131B0]
MHPMAPFVLPAALFFGIGTFPGIVLGHAACDQANRPGFKMVEQEMVEAGEAFGASRLAVLFLIKLPLAFRSITAGVNQCVMMSLSMVIIAS